MVNTVYRSENGIILDPFTLNTNSVIGDAFDLMKSNHIGGIPIVDKDKKLAGLLTNRDLRFENDMALSISKVMTNKNIITMTKLYILWLVFQDK